MYLSANDGEEHEEYNTNEKKNFTANWNWTYDVSGIFNTILFPYICFPFVSGYVVWNMIARQWHRVTEYLAAVSAGTAGGILTFPASIHHIFAGQQGRKAFMNAYHNIPIFLNRWKHCS